MAGLDEWKPGQGPPEWVPVVPPADALLLPRFPLFVIESEENPAALLRKAAREIAKPELQAQPCSEDRQDATLRPAVPPTSRDSPGLPEMISAVCQPGLGLGPLADTLASTAPDLWTAVAFDMIPQPLLVLNAEVVLKGLREQVRDNISWWQVRERARKEQMMVSLQGGLQALVTAGASPAEIAAYRMHVNRKVNEWYEGCRDQASECREHVRKLARSILDSVIPDRRNLEERVNRIAQKAYDDFMRDMDNLRRQNLSNVGISAQDDALLAIVDPSAASTGGTFILCIRHPTPETFQFLQFCWYEVYCVDAGGNRTHPASPGSYNAQMVFGGTACLPAQVRQINPVTGEPGIRRQPGMAGEHVDTLMPDSPFYGAPPTSSAAGTVVRAGGVVIMQDTPRIDPREAARLDAFVMTLCAACSGWVFHWHFTVYVVDKAGRVLASVSWEKIARYTHGSVMPNGERIQNVTVSPATALSYQHQALLNTTCTANGWSNPVVP